MAMAALFACNGKPVVITRGERGMLYGTAKTFERLSRLSRASDGHHGGRRHFSRGVRLWGLTDCLSSENAATGGRGRRTLGDSPRRPHVDSRPCRKCRRCCAMLDETSLSSGSRLCVVGNICRDVKTAPLRPDESPFPRRRDADRFHRRNDRRRRRQQRVVCGRARRGGAVRRQSGRRRPGRETRTSSARAVASRRSSATTRACNGQFRRPQLYQRLPPFHQSPDRTTTPSASRTSISPCWPTAGICSVPTSGFPTDAGRRQCPAPASGARPRFDNVPGPELGSLLGFRVGGADPGAERGRAKVLPLVDLVHGNVRELNLFADSTDLTTTLQRLTAWGAGAVVLHMGAQGAGYYCRRRVDRSSPARRCGSMSMPRAAGICSVSA